MAELTSLNRETVAIELMGREFLLACAPHEREGLLDAATHLDQTMRELHQHAKASNFDRLTILAAISMTYELITLRRQMQGNQGNLSHTITTMRQKLEQVLDVPAS